ncbi:MAG: NUDIX hydrolase [Dysgonomonas sp.]
MHPLSQFRYCPKCGSDRFVENNFKSKKCLSCGFVYYFNSCGATVAIIINKENELLVATRASDPAKGTFDLPGGFVDMYETAEEGVMREVKEETGLDVSRVEYLFSLPNIYVYSGFEVHTIDLFFLCHVGDTSKLDAEDDVAKLQFIKLEDIDPEQFGLNSVKTGIKKLLSSDILKKKNQ